MLLCNTFTKYVEQGLKTRHINIVIWKNENANRVVQQRILNSLTDLRLVRDAGIRSEHATTRLRMITTKREGKREPKAVSYAKNAVTEIRYENWEAHFHYACIRTQN